MPVLSRELPPNFMLVGYRHNAYDLRHGRDLTIATNKACFDMVNFAYVAAAGVRSCRLQDVPNTAIVPLRSPLEARRLALWVQPDFESPSPDSTVDLFIGALPYGFCHFRVAQLLSDAAGVPIYFAEPLFNNRDNNTARDNKATKPTACRVTVDARSVAAVQALSGTSIITGGGLLMAGSSIDDVAAFRQAVENRDDFLHEARVAMSGGAAATVSTRRALRTLVVEFRVRRNDCTTLPQAPAAARHH